jgi:hypothetical protein
VNQQWTLHDLVFLKENDVAIDGEIFEFVRAEENTHRDIAACSGCSVRTFGQHDPSCPRASILFEPRWLEILTHREVL